MKASELVLVLQKAISLYGDLPVCGVEGEFGDPYDLDIESLVPVETNYKAQEQYREYRYFEIR